MGNEFYYLDWVLMALNLYAYILIGNKNKLGFLLGGVGCILGIVLFGLTIVSVPLVIMYIAFGALNVINYMKWLKLG